MNERKVTLKELAKETGLSVNSVSLALRGMRVSKQTQQRVREAAEWLGYVGNAQASSIRTGFTRNIAVIVGDIANPHTAQVLKECVRRFTAARYNAIIYNTEEREALERTSIRSALRQNVDGVLISPMKANGKNIDLLAKSKVPTVVFGSQCENPQISSVCMDDEQAGYLAASHLIGLGYRKVLFVNGPMHAQDVKERLDGYLRAIKQHGLLADDADVIYADLTDNASWQAPLQTRLTQMQEPAAVLAYSDMLALLVYSFCTDKGLKVRHIAGFDNALDMLPASLRFPSSAEKAERIADVAPQMLLEQMHNRQAPAKHIVLEASLYNI